MTEGKGKEAGQNAFCGQGDSELAQESTDRRGWAHFCRRLILVLAPITLGHCLVLSYLQWSLSVQHTHNVEFGSVAEHVFLSIPDAKNAQKLSHQYAGKPHVAGTEGDFETAEFFLANLQESLGIPHQPGGLRNVFDAGSPESQAATRGVTKRDSPYAWIDTYYPIMNKPLDLALQIVDDDGSILWDADLTEHAPEGDDRDPDAAKYANAVPTFHGMSASGDVTGHLLNGNYCSKEDYEQLLADGASLEGSVLLCRYGGIARGLKIKPAQENGAAGVLIYSDPRDDGLVTVENGFIPYPDGPARNPTSVERGSVLFLTLYPGDPTTPGYPSYPNATRTEGASIPSIPSLPISWNNAKQLLKILQNGNALEGKQVRLLNKVKYDVMPIWNVMGVIPGHIKDEVVVAGNHRDAWVMGAADPTSGTVSIHEVIRGLGHLVKRGWKPLRTILICSWDAEENALIGSTEWGEDFADWIDQHVVAYFNLDGSAAGSQFGASGSPLLAHFMRKAAQDIPHPTDSNRTLWDARNDDGPLFQSDVDNTGENGTNTTRIGRTNAEPATVSTDDLGVAPLGSGSDFTVFLQRNGVPSNDFGFVPALHDPIYHYHSIFDTPTWQERYGDPEFSRHIAAAKFLGLQIMRMATTPLLPLNTTHYALQLEDYLNVVQSLPETQQLNLDLTELQRAIHRIQRASRKLDKEKRRITLELQRLAYHWWDRGHRHEHRRISPRSRVDETANFLANFFDRIKAWIASGDICFTRTLFLPSGNDRQAQTNDFTAPGTHYSIEFSQVILDVMSQVGHGTVEHAGGPDHLQDDRFLGRHAKWHNALIHPIRHVQKINRKLRSFERGFISEEGIKDREWYRHLGVAPGRLLGYGATTFPGLTEAIVFDRNKNAAELEMKRLITLLDNITATLEA